MNERTMLERAARDVFALYPKHWDRVDGCLVVMSENVAEFDEAFERLGVALGVLVDDSDDHPATHHQAQAGGVNQ